MTKETLKTLQNKYRVSLFLTFTILTFILLVIFLSWLKITNKVFASPDLEPVVEQSPISTTKATGLPDLEGKQGLQSLRIEQSPSVEQIINTSALLTPYLEYQDKEGNIIREYRFFPEMQPKEKDIKERVNFFHRADFEANMQKYGLKAYPLIWVTGCENLYNLECEGDQVKKKYGWEVSKANYQLIQTNKPTNTTEMLTYDCRCWGDFYNNSICFLNTINPIDIEYRLNFHKDIKEKAAYIRFLTKNLEIEFDWLTFICQHFDTLLDVKIAINYCNEANHFITDAKKVIVKKAFNKEITFINLSETINHLKTAIKNAQNCITEAKNQNQPTFNINLTEKTIIGGLHNEPITFPYLVITYNLQDFIDYINKLDLSKSDLQKTRKFVNDFALSSNKQ